MYQPLSTEHGLTQIFYHYLFSCPVQISVKTALSPPVPICEKTVTTIGEENDPSDATSLRLRLWNNTTDENHKSVRRGNKHLPLVCAWLKGHSGMTAK